MKSSLVIGGMFVVSLATAPGLHAEGRRDSGAAAPAQPRAVAVQRSEPRATPSPAFGGGERGGVRPAAREERAQGRSMPRESAPPAPAPRSAPAPAPAPAQVSAPALASGSGAVNEQRARGRSAPRDSSGGGRAQAAPRGERRAADSGRATQPSSAGSAGARGERHATGGDGNGQRATAAPRADRPSEGRYPVGQATRRTHPPYGGGSDGYYGRPAYYYRPAAFYGYGALGLGYFYYDPFWWGYPGYGYSPYGYYGGPYYGGYYGGGYYGGGYGGGYYGGGYDVGYGSGNGSGYYGTGHLKLKLKPRDAEVYVDGYYAGLVDDFDGMFQKLELEAGPHRIEVRKAGFSTMTFEVRVPTDESVTYRGELKPLP